MEERVPEATAYSMLSTLQAANGELMIGGARAILMTEDAYALLLRVIHEHAPHVVKYAFYDMGFRSGRVMMESLAQRASDPEAAFRYFVEMYRQTGYGDLEVTSFDLSKPEATLRGTNLFEAGLVGKTGIYRSPRTVDHYTRGMFAGFLSSLAGREVICEELACQFRGDPACEFVVLPREV
jgi:predicted hydrocarbon binding protein